MSDDPTLAGVRARMAGGGRPGDEARAAVARADAWADPALFLHRLDAGAAARAAPIATPTTPLAGVVLAVKDNLDVAGMPTTAGCPSYAYHPAADAAAVARLRAAGALPIAKTNLDQFATGLVGTRSPAGTPRNPFDAKLVPGGSSSGSACAVAAGIVPAALGTDTAGSGRVPAAFTGIVGFKPTRGWISTRGLVPAVRSLDCVSVFALTVEDAWTVATVAAGFDPEDPFARVAQPAGPVTDRLRIGVPADAHLDGVVEPSLLACWRAAIAALRELGHELEPIELEPFLAAARLLYEGPWVAERTAAIGDFLARAPRDADPTVAAIIARGAAHDAVAAWRGTYELARLRRLAEAQWARMDLLALPTAPEHPTRAAVAADPLGVDARLGRFTNFANLLDTCAVALPAGTRPGGLPAGLTLFAPAWHDATACRVAAQLQGRLGLPLGATGRACPRRQMIAGEGAITVAVFGAHLSGQPLNHRLVGLGGRPRGACRTAPEYRCHLLEGRIARPGLVRVGASGRTIAGEIWELPPAGFGRLVAEVGAPLAIGPVRLEDGREVPGYVCAALPPGAPDISAYGSWPAFLAARD